MRYRRCETHKHGRTPLKHHSAPPRWPWHPAAALALAGALFNGGCGGEQAPTAAALVGDWFRCEWVDEDNLEAPPKDGCAMLDDDGLRFSAEGQAYEIEVQDSSETACAADNAGACFSRESTAVTISGELIGEYSLKEGHVVISAPDGERIEFDLVPGQDYAEFLNYRKIKGDETKSVTKYRYMFRYR